MATNEENTLKAAKEVSKANPSKELPTLKSTLVPADSKVRITPKVTEDNPSGNASESGSDNDDELESGNSVEEVALEEAEAAEAGAQGLFGGMGLAAGADVAATGGLSALGLLSGLGVGSNDLPPDGPPPEFQVLKATSSGLNVGPSADGSGPQGLSMNNTELTLGGNAQPVATVSEVSLIDPSAPLPSGNPISVDPASQQLSADLGPVGQVAAGISPDPISSSALSLIDGATSGNLELENLVGLDIPTSIAGNDVPVTASLSDGLTQLGDALTPVTDPLTAVFAGGLAEGGNNPLANLPVVGDFIEQGASALSDIPVLGPVATQLTGDITLENLSSGSGDSPISDIPLLGPVVDQGMGILSGPSPVGELPVGAGTQIPSTVPELELVTGPVTSAINSTAAGENPLAQVASALPL